MRVGEAVAEPLACLQVHGDHSARVAELLVAVGLEPDAAHRWPHEFSGGQRHGWRSPGRWRPGPTCWSPTSR
jgi:peptide/nickel transport system ATP-binding protein